MMQDRKATLRFSRKPRVAKALHALAGLLEGTLADGVVSGAEANVLRVWMDEHADVSMLHPLSELFPAVEEVLTLHDAPERLASILEDIRWLGAREVARGRDPLDADLQLLLGLLGGVAADGALTDDEIAHVRAWVRDHDHLASVWPYDEVRSVIVGALRDGFVDPVERDQMLEFFQEFTRTTAHRAISPFEAEFGGTVVGLCAVAPEIAFDGKAFCFTGAFKAHLRTRLHAVVAELGGNALADVSRKVDFLVVGGEGSPCWAHACYGRKVEKAMLLRREGHRLVVLHENDFLDALQDEGVELRPLEGN